MNSGTAWKPIPEDAPKRGRETPTSFSEPYPRAAIGGQAVVKHPTTAWPPTHGPRAMVIPEDMDPTPAPTFRRAPRPVRQTPTVPWFFLITSVLMLTALIMLVVKQRAELVKEQYKLVDLRSQRTRVLKERSELRLGIQRLTALERVDGVVRKHLKMVRPEHRLVLDLSQYALSDAPPAAAHVAARPKPEEATQ